MSVAEIIALGVDVQKIALPDSHLYLWVTNNYLERAFEVVKAWGFKYITTITWEKERQGLGQYFRGTTEHVLFCKRGQPAYRANPINGKRAQGRTGFQTKAEDVATLIEGMWFAAQREAHSKKPDQVHAWAELVSHGPYLEMFARTARPGWDAWGLEAPSTLEDILS